MRPILAIRKPVRLPADKNPAHPSALRIRDLHPGRRVILFSTLFGVELEGTIMDRPHVLDSPFRGRTLAVTIRYCFAGETRYAITAEHRLTEAGVIPYATSGWDQCTFLIDARKRHLLPVPTINRIPSGADGPEYGEAGDDYDEDDYEPVDGINDDGMSWSL